MEQSFGRYRLLERLGEGGMAEVFKAKSFGVEGFEKVLVIKRILPKLAEHAKFVDMFVHEAKLAVRLSHANIVQVFDLGRVDHPNGDPTSYFIAMEYVPGLDLASLLTRCRRSKREIPVGMAVFIIAEVAKALDHAHRRRDEQSRPLGIVHRDISPQNMLLSWEGEVKVTDFGIAKAIDSISDEEKDHEHGRVRGKLAYMSPEQSRAEPVDGRSDIFSLGIVLYELLAGANPFTAPTSFETLRRVQASEYPPIDLFRQDAPQAVKDIVARMLARDPTQRFPDAGRLHEELLGFFYGAGQRFGANDLAEFLEPFRDAGAAPELAPALQDEHVAANERTPVEVPRANTTGVGKTGTPMTQTAERADGLVNALRSPEMGQRRDVTALVLSFVGNERDRRLATESGERVGVVVRAETVLARYGATVLEKESSQLTALFGVQDADGRDTEAAVRAALLLQRARVGGVSVSAGVHVARILVDPSGEPVKDQRLASLISTAQGLARAADNAVCVSQIASRIIRSVFSTEDLPSSGRAGPEGGRLVVSARAPSQIYGRFVGRHDELKKLGDVLAAATRRRTQIMVVLGEKGIGKTRLIAEMERRLAKGNYNVGFYMASCPRNGAEVQWSGLTAMLQVLCGVHEGDDEARIRDVLPRLRALGLQDEESAAVLHQLGATMDEGDVTTQSARRRATAVTAAALRAAFGRMVQGLCDDRLQVFAWDDAQAIDPMTLEALLATANRATGASGLRAMIVLLARRASDDAGDAAPAANEKIVTAFDGYPYVHRMDLDQLSDDDTAKLIASRVNARIVPPELLAFCRERAGGHPLFLEELLKELTDSGAVSSAAGSLRLRLDGAVSAPRTLRTLIAARVARLSPELRAVLQAAAILGAPVPTEVLATLLTQKVSQVDRAIAQLASKDLLRATGPALADFASPMHGEIVLDLIPPELRRELHAASAAAYLQVMGDEGAEHAERVAQHLYEAGDRDRAATFYAKAAIHKLRFGQLEPAVRLMCRALELADLERRSSGELVKWLGALSGALFHVRSAPEIYDLALRALSVVDATGALDEQFTARIDMARALSSANQFEEAYACLSEANLLTDKRDDLKKRVLAAEAEMAARTGDFTRALRAVEKLEAMGPIESDRMLLAIAHVRATRGDMDEALRALDQAALLADPSDLAAACQRAKQRVLVYVYCRKFKEGVDASSEAVALARAANLRYEIAVTLHNLGESARRLGDHPRAYASLTESLEVAQAAGYERLVSLNRIHLAFLDGLNGVAGSETLLRDLVRYANTRGYWTDALEGRYLLGKVLLHRGEKDDAKRELEEVLSLASAKGNRLIADDAIEALAQC